MPFCTSCGAPLTATAFCSNCGAPAPGPPLNPPQLQPQIQVSGQGQTQGQPVDLSRILAGNWVAAFVTALLAVAIAVGASAALLWMGDPDHTSLDDRLTLTAISAAASVGADAVGSIEEAGGSGEIQAAGGVVPLLISLLSLGVAALVFRRFTAGYGRIGFALGDALRTALVHAVLMTVLVAVFRGGEGALMRELDFDGDDPSWGASIPTTFFGSLLVMFTVLALACLVRRDWLGPRATKVHDLVAAPLSGLALFVVLLVPAGAIGWGALLLTGSDDTTSTDDGLGFLQVVAVVTYPLANVGLLFLHAGVGGSAGTSWDARDLDEGRGNEWERLAKAVEDSGAWGLWFAIPTAILVLALCAWLVVRRSRPTGKPFANLMVWAGSMFVVVPLLGRLASLHGAGEASEDGIVGAVNYDFEGYAGLRPVDTLLLPLVALAVALLIAALSGILNAKALSTRLGQFQQSPTAPPHLVPSQQWGPPPQQ